MMFKTCQAIIKPININTVRNSKNIRLAQSTKVAASEICIVDPEYMYTHISGLHGNQRDIDPKSPGYGQWRGNFNGDHFWWKKTLLEYKTRLGMHAFETWRGKDCLENHDEGRVLGDIPDVWLDIADKSVDMLIRTSTKRAWTICESVRRGSVTDVSMGTLVGHSFCSICNNRAETENEWCLIGDTEILLDDYSRKPIKEIKIGDKVITHRGRIKKVLETMNREINEDIYELTILGSRKKINITGNHELLIIPKEGFSCGIDKKQPCKPYSLNVCEKFAHRIGCINTRKFRQPQWIKAENLRPGDCVLVPIINNEYISSITKEEAKFIGYYAAEGYISYQSTGTLHAIDISLHEDELSIIDFIFEFAKQKRWNEPRIYESKNSKGISVKIHDVNACKWIMQYAIGKAVNKRLSIEVINSSNQSKIEFLKAFFEGDGWLANVNGNERLAVEVASKVLRDQIVSLLNSIGIVATEFEQQNRPGPTLRKKGKIGNEGMIYRASLSSSNTKKFLYGNESIRLRAQYGNSYYLYKIKAIELKKFEGKVYNFEVENDNSYLANNFVVHNCDDLKQKKAQFLQPDELPSKLRDEFSNGKWVYEDNRDIYGIEISWITVGEGADQDAKVKNLIFDAQKDHRQGRMQTNIVDTFWNKYGRIT